jgi:hypothetical protein
MTANKVNGNIQAFFHYQTVSLPLASADGLRNKK